MADAACKAERRSDNDGASYEDAHVSSPVLMSSRHDYIDSPRKSCDTLDTQHPKNEGGKAIPLIWERGEI